MSNGSSADHPQQQGCSLVNLLGCFVVPLGIWFGARVGYHYGALGGGVLGAIVGALLSVPSIVLLVFLIALLAHFETVLARLLRRK